MTTLEDRRLRGDSLVVVLSGAHKGRYSDLKSRLLEVFSEEEYFEIPGEQEVHDAVKRLGFTRTDGTATTNFVNAFHDITQIGYVKSSGRGNDYSVYATVNRRAIEISREGIIPLEHCDYLQALGKKVDLAG